MLTIFPRLSVYIAAVVIFISWLITNTFVTTFDRDTQSMDAVKAEENESQQFSMQSDGERAVLRQLADIEDSVAKLRTEGKPTEQQNHGDEVDADQRWVESFQSDSAYLVERAKELEELGKRVQPSQDLEQSIKSIIERTTAFDVGVQKATSAYKKERETGPPSESGQDETSVEARRTYDAKIDGDFETIAKMEAAFEKLDQEVVSLYDKMESYIEEKRERSAQHAEVASIVAYVFYALGTAIGGLGKWLENKQKVRSPAAT
jgi:low affinity Fe/Cu permease